MNYFVISRCEDEIYFEVMTAKQIAKQLDELIENESKTTFITDASKIESDLGYFPINSMLIIKGKEIEPVATETVRRWGIE